MRLGLLSLVLAQLALLLIAAPVEAQWSPRGVRLCQNGCAGDLPRIIGDGAGGAFVAWRDYSNRAATDADLYLQRVTASGLIAPGWPPGGVPVVVVVDSQDAPDLALDGQGGVLIAWQDFRNSGTGGTSLDVYAQRIQGDGSIAPGWPANGAPATRAPDYQEFPVIAPDGA